MGLADRLKRGLARSREALSEIFYMGGEVDEDFWEELEKNNAYNEDHDTQ